MARKKVSGLRVRILIGEATALGPGKVDLLDHIARTGSISAAARAMGMSYRRAWLLVDTMNRCFHGNLIETATGGPGGGGAHITPLGREVLKRYRAMEAKAQASVRAEIDSFAKLLSPAGRDG
jgi:molybdate transport system regulatory protein